MAEAVYIMCGVASLVCAVLLWRGYRRSRARLPLLRHERTNLVRNELDRLLSNRRQRL